jgi:hypothetical protein
MTPEAAGLTEVSSSRRELGSSSPPIALGLWRRRLVSHCPARPPETLCSQPQRVARCGVSSKLSALSDKLDLEQTALDNAGLQVPRARRYTTETAVAHDT